MIYEKDKLDNISFPLGGIGTGSVGIAGNGALIGKFSTDRTREVQTDILILRSV